MTWKPGESGNPKGQPHRTKIWRDAIIRAIKRRELKDPLAMEKLADKLLNAIDDGDVSAMREFGDRVDGKVSQPVGGADDLPPQKVQYDWDLTKLTDEQLEALRQILIVAKPDPTDDGGDLPHEKCRQPAVCGR
jgi:hypothetical protein